MNKENWADYLESVLEDCKCRSTFKETSKDDANSHYLCNDDDKTKKVYDFDRYVKKQYPKLNRPASPDAIYLGNKKLYFVEFKNQSENTFDKDKEKEKIRKKFESGTKILQELLQNYSSTDCKKYFCLVVNINKNIKNQGYKNVALRQNTTLSVESYLNELNKTSGNFYDSVYANDVDFYKKEFIDLSCDYFF